MAIAIEPRDSIPLTLRATRQEQGSWTALATLPNGGRFEIFIDNARRRGEFRSVGDDEDQKVLFGLAALIAPRS